MPSETEALGRRAVACPKWRWLPGMVARGTNRIWGWLSWVRVEAFSNSETCGEKAEQLENPYPDLNDYATLGCLLRLVREAWGDNYAWMRATNRYYAFSERGADCCEPAWILHVLDPLTQTYRKIPGITEAEALIAALEAAP